MVNDNVSVFPRAKNAAFENAAAEFATVTNPKTTAA